MTDGALNPSSLTVDVHLMTTSFAAVAVVEVGGEFDGCVEPVVAVGACCCLISIAGVG